jgi:predicted nuclease of predicted toxin-antitoxin system
MNIMDLIGSGGDYTVLVKKTIGKVFAHEARKYKCKEQDLNIILGIDDAKDIQIMTYSRTDNRVLRIIPDKEAQEILMK